MGFELSLKKYSFHEHKRFDPRLIRIDQATRDLCKQNSCGQYGKNHMCPPAIKGIEEWGKEVLSYDNAVIVTKVYSTKNSYDMEAMFDGIRDFQKVLVGLKEDIKYQFPEKRFLVLGAGSCFICKKCTYEDENPCRFPDKAFPSLEACGIDVMSLSKSVGVKYNNGKNTVTYLGGIFY